MTTVACPRRHPRLNARLHMIVSTDAHACPRCLGRDGIEIPMAYANEPETNPEANGRPDGEIGTQLQRD